MYDIHVYMRESERGQMNRVTWERMNRAVRGYINKTGTGEVKYIKIKR